MNRNKGRGAKRQVDEEFLSLNISLPRFCAILSEFSWEAKQQAVFIFVVVFR